MTTFVIEAFVPRSNPGALHKGSRRAHEAAEELFHLGTPVRYLQSIFVVEDQKCLHLYEAPSAESVRKAATRAALPCNRIREVIRTKSTRRASSQAQTAKLTSRELEVLDLLADGLRNAEIAQRLFVSPRTVDHHVSAILRKLGVKSRGQAVAEAARLRLTLESR
jgi:DNA-binding NarL/FixJ family response regulator